MVVNKDYKKYDFAELHKRIQTFTISIVAVCLAIIAISITLSILRISWLI